VNDPGGGRPRGGDVSFSPGEKDAFFFEENGARRGEGGSLKEGWPLFSFNERGGLIPPRGRELFSHRGEEGSGKEEGFRGDARRSLSASRKKGIARKGKRGRCLSSGNKKSSTQLGMSGEGKGRAMVQRSATFKKEERSRRGETLILTGKKGAKTSDVALGQKEGRSWELKKKKRGGATPSQEKPSTSFTEFFSEKKK